MKNRNHLILFLVVLVIVILSNNDFSGHSFRSIITNVDRGITSVSANNIGNFRGTGSSIQDPHLIDTNFLSSGFLPLIIGSVTGNTNWPAVGDFNNDSWKDVFNSRWSLNIFNLQITQLLLMNDGTGNLIVNDLTSLPAGSTFTAGVADFDNDGDQDVFLGNGADGVFSNCGTSDYLFLNDGNGNFQYAYNFGDSDKASDVGIGDINNDGWKDIIVATSPGNCGNQNSKLYINQLLLRYDTDVLIFQDITTISLPGINLPADSLELEDLDLDGDLDIVSSRVGSAPNYCSGIRVFKNNGLGIFTEQILATPSSVSAYFCYRLEAVDLDNDNDKDLVFTNPTSNSAANGLVFLKNVGSGIFTNQAVVVDSVNYPNSVVYSGAVTYDVDSGDVNNDGKFDLFVTIPTDTPHPILGRKFVLLNNGNWNFNRLQNLGSMWTGLNSMVNGTIITLVDVNNDNKLDVFLNRRSGTLNLGQASALFYHV